jgi:signal transduction histidine kinase/CheY-like chemotaxis protein
MKKRLLTVAIERETDIVVVRERTRRIAALAGFDRQDQTRITTAVSEIARNAWEYGKGGRVEYWISGDDGGQTLDIVVEDRGPGISGLEAILAGDYKSPTGMGLGIVGARRLMDDFAVESVKGQGAKVTMRKALPQRGAITQKDIGKITTALAAQHGAANPLEEIRQQNREMLAQLEELNQRQQQLSHLNQELQDTNRGVVALYAELDERADHLRRADELKSRFLSNMSHEFRTPLNSIMALSRLLLARSDGDLTAEQEKQVQFIRKAAENLTELTNDLLDLAKVEAGKTVVTPSDFTAAGLFGALRGMLRPLLIGDRVSLVFEDAADIPPLVGDEGKVSQILRNFISNALKFTEQGEVRVWAQLEPDDRVSFYVRDSGIGIAPENIDYIWQEFSQVAHPLQRNFKGTGLGLPLSRRLAELLGGGVGVESAVGEGSVFRLTIPRVYRLADAEEGEGDWRLDPDKVAILSVEDDDADTFVIERAFAETRYQAITARSVREAKKALERVSPAAIVLDLLLVGEESWGLLIELKQRPLTQHIPVVVLSGSGEERKARSLGADEFLAKPVDPRRLLSTLDALTGNHSVTKIMLCDDEEVFRYLVRQLLPRGAFELVETCATDCLVDAAQTRPDAVLLDLNMPTINGFEILALLKNDERTRGVPVVVLTSLHVGDEHKRLLTSASCVLSKSDLSTEVLVAAIREVTAMRQAAQ